MCGLDPCHFYTSPALSCHAMLKSTGVNLELLTDIDILLFFEKGIRGGLVQVTGRHALANHPYMGDSYDATRPFSYLFYTDCVTLYSYTMKLLLPTG